MMIQLQGVSATCSKAILALQVVIIPPPVIVTLWESLKQVGFRMIFLSVAYA